MQNKISKFIVAIGFAVLAASPALVYAQTAPATPPAQKPTELPVYNAGVDRSIQDYLCTPSVPADGHDLERCVNRLYRFGISAGALVIVFLIIYAGYIYITSDEGGKTKAKGYLKNSLTGMGIMIGSYVLLNFINPSLVAFKSIQPPIFNAADLPSCEEIGFSGNCLITSGANAGQVVSGSGRCAMPLDASKVKGFNNTVHNPWDNNPATPDRHRTVHHQPNSPPPEGAVDAAMGKGNPSTPVFAPIDGMVYVRKDLGDGTGGYITITSDIRPGADCSKANSCASLAHIDPTVKVGDTVAAGQQIGITHMYSGALGPHLHFELKLNGQWITGDGRAGTWNNMKQSLSTCSGASNGGSLPSGLVNVNSVVPSLLVDMQYASAIPSSNNFMMTALYVGAYSKYGSACYLTQATADKLKKAAENLAKVNSSYKLKAWDCYRPIEIQKQMRDWGDKQKPPYGKDKIASPGGGLHPKGMAIDLTIDGLSMPTKFDDFNNSAKSNANSEILRKAMEGAGFTKAKTEWWHFN